MASLFSGLSAFPLTPADADGVVDVDALGLLIERLIRADVDSIGLLGSTGIYAYLDRDQRARAVAAAVEAANANVPLVVGVGALRTNWAVELARDAERAGAAGLLLAPMSYTPLTTAEVAAHYRTVAASTGLPICIYNNPGTTNFRFPDELVGDLASAPGIAAIKMPLPVEGDFAGELARLRARTPSKFAIGYSGDWGAAPSLLAGGDAWYSVLAGLLPGPASRLTRAALDADVQAVAALEADLAPLWSLFKAHGSIRIMYAIADRLSLSVGDPPLPIARVPSDVVSDVEGVLDRLLAPKIDRSLAAPADPANR